VFKCTYYTCWKHQSRCSAPSKDPLHFAASPNSKSTCRSKNTIVLDGLCDPLDRYLTVAVLMTLLMKRQFLYHCCPLVTGIPLDVFRFCTYNLNRRSVIIRNFICLGSAEIAFMPNLFTRSVNVAVRFRSM